MKLERGAVLLIDLDPTVGHEQRGLRPCIAVSDPDITADQRFPLIGVIPITGTAGQGILYPELAPGKSGLTKTSYALIDHVRSIDKRRIRHVFGRLMAGEMHVVDEGLALFLGLRFPGEYLTERAQKGSQAKFRKALGKVRAVPPDSGDEI